MHCKFYLAIRVWEERVKQYHPKRCMYHNLTCQQDEKFRINPILIVIVFLKLTREESYLAKMHERPRATSS